MPAVRVGNFLLYFSHVGPTGSWWRGCTLAYPGRIRPCVPSMLCLMSSFTQVHSVKAFTSVDNRDSSCLSVSHVTLSQSQTATSPQQNEKDSSSDSFLFQHSSFGSHRLPAPPAASRAPPLPSPAAYRKQLPSESTHHLRISTTQAPQRTSTAAGHPARWSAAPHVEAGSALGRYQLLPAAVSTGTRHRSLPRCGSCRGPCRG
eukprot:COSAG01_NODE_339_length_18653_cov_21.648378_4_plen_203_part_00